MCEMRADELISDDPRTINSGPRKKGLMKVHPATSQSHKVHRNDRGRTSRMPSFRAQRMHTTTLSDHLYFFSTFLLFSTRAASLLTASDGAPERLWQYLLCSSWLLKAGYC